jgi:DNA-binding XRE family transcriptional regulator
MKKAKRREWTAQRLRQLRNRYGISVQELASLIGANSSTVFRWESAPKAAAVDPAFERWILLMERCTDVGVAETLRTRIAMGWWTGALEALLHWANDATRDGR